MKRIYMDHNATTPVHPDVLAAMTPFLEEHFGNPSSTHWAGTDVTPHIEEARQSAATLIGARPEDIIFTAGGSEGDNMALKGVLMLKGKKSHCVISDVEHPAIHSTCELLETFGFRCTYVPVNQYGIVEPEAVRAAMTPETALISIMHANNETGAVNPIADIAKLVRGGGALMHTDAVQTVGKVPVDVDELGVDMLTASGHKFNAPKGVGFQYVRQGVKLAPLISGGDQERGLRAGTENVPGIVGIGAACRVAMKSMRARHDEIGAMRDRLERGILDSVPGSLVNGHPERRVYNTLSISFPGIEGEALMMQLSLAGIAVSTGSACHSDTGKPSRVLGAMGLDAVRARGTLRLSLGLGITEEDIDYVLKKLPPLANQLIEMSPVN